MQEVPAETNTLYSIVCAAQTAAMNRRTARDAACSATHATTTAETETELQGAAPWYAATSFELRQADPDRRRRALIS